MTCTARWLRGIGGHHLGWCHLSFFFGGPSLSVLWGSSYRCTPAFVFWAPAAGDSAWLQHNRLDELQKTLQTDWITNSIRWCLACQRFHSPLRVSVLSAHLAAHSISPRHMHLQHLLNPLFDQLASAYFAAGSKVKTESQAPRVLKTYKHRYT